MGSSLYLPDDILYEIFKLATEDDPISGLVYLSHCCQKWRLTALNAPTLWTSILINRPHPRYLDRHRAWMERSQANHLDVTILQPSFEATVVFEEYLCNSLEVLKPHCDRWRSLSITILKYTTAKLIYPVFTPLQFSELSKISFKFEKEASGTIIQLWMLFPRELPKLDSLEIIGTRLMSRDNWWLVPPFQPSLRSLVIRDPGEPVTLDIYLAILRRCSFLEELVFDALIQQSPPQSESPNLYHPSEDGIISALKLKKLNLGSLCAPGLSRFALPFLVHVQAPYLTALSPYFVPIEFIPTLVSLKNFPFPSLESISLTTYDREPKVLDTNLFDSLLTLLSHLPKLYDLEIKNIQLPPTLRLSDNNPLMAALAIHCPCLAILTLLGCEGVTFEGVRMMIETRKGKESETFSAITSLNLCDLTEALTDEQEEWLIWNIPELYLNDKLVGYDGVPQGVEGENFNDDQYDSGYGWVYGPDTYSDD